jgi:hypothetical protein
VRARPHIGVRWQGHESCGPRILGHPWHGRSVGLGEPQVGRADKSDGTIPTARTEQAAGRQGSEKCVRDTSHLGHSGVAICCVSLD